MNDIRQRLRAAALRAREFVRSELAAARGDRRRALVLAAVVAGTVCAGGLGFGAGAWMNACAGGCPTGEEIDSFAPQEASVVLDANGGTLGLFYRERRQIVDISTLPAHVPAAFVAVEDRRFFKHRGVDPFRFVAAVRDNLFGGWGGPGGSTITMQLARNLFPRQLPANEKSLRRKFAEIRLALQIERRFDKQKILELYLNHIYLGSGAYGIEAAARTYFGRPASQLTVTEAATLAGLPKAPSYYDPRRNPEAALERRNLVLREMVEFGVIEGEEADQAVQAELGLSPPGGARRAPYVVEQIRRDLEERFGELLYTGGLRIHTAIDSATQAEAEAALEAQLKTIEAGTYGRFRHPTYAQVSETAGEGERLTRTPYLQGAVVMMNPHTGDVLAMVGGRDFDHSQFNRATQALRQPGSAFKPFVYGAAIEKGRSPLSRVNDAPVAVRQADGTVWEPKNYDGTMGGNMSLREALRDSRNLAAIRLGQEIGAPAVIDVARRAGITTPIPAYPSTFIGAAAVYPLSLVSAYATFANGGTRVKPRLVTRIEDRNGELLWEPIDPPQPALKPGVTWILTDMLREVVDRGTAYGVRNPYVGDLPWEIPAAGKTGTTNSNTDVWFIGYTPDVVAGVWLGFDEPTTITSGATGGGFAVPVWAHVVRKYYDNHTVEGRWKRPSDVVIREVSGWTGRVVSEDCIDAFDAQPDYFLAGSVPRPDCRSPGVIGDPTPELPGTPIFPGRPRTPEINQVVPRRPRGTAAP